MNGFEAGRGNFVPAFSGVLCGAGDWRFDEVATSTMIRLGPMRPCIKLTIRLR